MAGVNGTAGKCTREGLFPGTMPHGSRKEILAGISDICLRLLKGAAKLLCNSRERADKLSIHDAAISDIYLFLRILYEKECKSGRESQTLSRAIESQWTLRKKFFLYIKNKKADTKPGSPSRDGRILGNYTDDMEFGEGQELFENRYTYYRARIYKVLRSENYLVADKQTKYKNKKGGKILFSCGARDIPQLSDADFLSRLPELASGFEPALRDDDFWKGEEKQILPDGGERQCEGPGGQQLAQFCEELFRHVAVFFGREYLLSLDMVMDMLARLYTYFRGEKFLALSSSSDDEDVGPSVIPEAHIVYEGPSYNGEEQARRVIEEKKNIIIARIRELDRDDAMILCGEYENKTDKELSQLLRAGRSGQIYRKKDKAYSALAESVGGLLKEADVIHSDGVAIEDNLRNKYVMNELFSLVLHAWRGEYMKAVEEAGLREANK